MFKITKLKHWAIYFTNQHGIRFLLHISGDGFENGIAIYRRELSEHGNNINLEWISGSIHCGSYLNGFQYKQGTTYKEMGDSELIEYLFDQFGVMKFQEIRDCKEGEKYGSYEIKDEWVEV